MQSTEQADFAQRLLANDEQVLEEILRSFGPMILAVLTRRYREVLRETDVEDVVSIGLYRLWINRIRFDRRKASLKVWFFRIVENAARDVLRHGWHKARILETGSDSALIGVTDPSLNGRADADDTPQPPTNLQLDLREIVAELPKTQRLIIAADSAAKDTTASSQRLGDELGIPAATVRVYRKRAMDRIRTELVRKGHDVPGMTRD